MRNIARQRHKHDGSAREPAPSRKPVLRLLPERRLVGHCRGRLVDFTKPLCRFASIRQDIGDRHRSLGNIVNGFRHQTIAPEEAFTRMALNPALVLITQSASAAKRTGCPVPARTA